MEEEQEIWRTPSWLYPCILTVSGVLIFYRNRSASRDKGTPFLSIFLPASFLSFQRRFLTVFYLALAAESLQLISGESFLTGKGLKREDIAFYLVVSHAASLVLGTSLGIICDHMLRGAVGRAVESWAIAFLCWVMVVLARVQLFVVGQCCFEAF